MTKTTTKPKTTKINAPLLWKVQKAIIAEPLKFDLIVTDLAMPGMTGLDFAAEIRGDGADIPIVLTSGYLRPQDEEAAQRLGLREFVAKPATIDGLCRSIHAALSRGDRADPP